MLKILKIQHTDFTRGWRAWESFKESQIRHVI
nr:MAG TPA: hypothetical protein [Caudoviricetes sp.]